MSQFDFEAMKEILRCPKCHSSLVLHDSNLVCTSNDCRLQYSIEDEIPIMLIDSATELPDDEWERILETQSE